jgi:type II secretory pathway pseudopilin PulG
MINQRGTTLLELTVLLAIMGIVCGIAVPGAVSAKRAFAVNAAQRHLALLLRDAQARAEALDHRVAVTVADDGSFVVKDLLPASDGPALTNGKLGVAVSSSYPGGALEIDPRGWPALPGASSPRAGHFTIASAGATRTVVVQLAGCVRCE